jgi:hypothetical protein
MLMYVTGHALRDSVTKVEKRKAIKNSIYS